jgi:hypothetical protein
MLFHPAPEQPTAPNAGILRLEPGAHHPEHYHGFAQVWFILKGEFTIDGRLCPPGTMLYHPDPHFEGAFHTATGSGRGWRLSTRLRPDRVNLAHLVGACRYLHIEPAIGESPAGRYTTDD